MERAEASPKGRRDQAVPKRAESVCVTKRYITDCDMVRSSRRLEESTRKRCVRNTNVTLYEHHFNMNGSWRNWVTCARGIHDHALCCSKLGDKTRRWVGFFTVVDMSEWKDQKGTIRKNELALLAAPLNVLKILESRKSDSDGSLIGALMTIQRIGETSAAVGNDFVVKKVGDLSKLAPEVYFRGKKLRDLVSAANSNPDEARQYANRFQVERGPDGTFPFELRPFRYMEILKPKTQKEMKDFLSSYEAPGDGGGGGGGGSEADQPDDDMPF